MQSLMQIIMGPGEVAKIAGMNGTALKPEEVCLRAVSLLKTVINSSWELPDESGSNDKENVSANQHQGFQAMISQEDKAFIKANILGCLDLYAS